MPKSNTLVDTLIEQIYGQDWTARCEEARLLGQSGQRGTMGAARKTILYRNRFSL